MTACTREGLTPDIDGGTDTLIVDCSVHGEIGRIPAGRFEHRDGEYDDAEALFSEHVAAVSAPTTDTAQEGRTDA